LEKNKNFVTCLSVQMLHVNSSILCSFSILIKIFSFYLRLAN
jgi:hypothetical protein